MSKPRIVHLSGSTATIQNTPPLVTSNKARAAAGLPPRTDRSGAPLRYDALRPQRLAAPVVAYVEHHSAHPLEADSEALHAPAEGWLSPDGTFSQTRGSDADRPVHRVELDPADGLYPLPYMAFQADGSPWEDATTQPGVDDDGARQTFFPDGSRSFEEIDRLSVDGTGVAGALSALAEFDFIRVSPPGGWRRGLPAEARADRGDGPIAPETRGREFFPYYPFHLYAGPSRPALAGITNAVQAALGASDYDGAIWTQGSPQIEETAWWFNLLIDTTKPIVGCAAQRPQGQTSHDGPQNLIDATRLIADRVWADAEGVNRLGVVLVQDQLVYAAREVTKVDARPGGYATSGYGGVLGGVSHRGDAEIFYLPARKHTHRSELRLTALPEATQAVGREGGVLRLAPAPVLDASGALLPEAIPSVMIVKDGSYSAEEVDGAPEDELDLVAMIDAMLGRGRLAGFVAEGLSPYGILASNPRQTLLSRAVFAGLP
ncbi:MAG: asparaginase domain-containing protein, partial [Pseudomonadota bacterium]